MFSDGICHMQRYFCSYNQNKLFFVFLITFVCDEDENQSNSVTIVAANEDSESESEEESETSESEEESDADTSGLDLDACPSGCDQSLYDNTCLLREKRIDIEEQLVEERFNKETILKELETMQKRVQAIESAIKTVEQELEASQVGAISICTCFNFSSNTEVLCLVPQYIVYFG